MPPDPDVLAALHQVRDALASDLVELFGHDDAALAVHDDGPLRLVAEGARGRFELTWPPSEGFVKAEGPLGAHAKVAFEFLLAAETPADLFDGYRPSHPERRRVVFDALEAYVDETLGGNRYYADLVVARRGAALLVFGDDEYAIVTDDGKHRGSGILHWKVKRLAAYALTDADEAFGPGDG